MHEIQVRLEKGLVYKLAIQRKWRVVLLGIIGTDLVRTRAIWPVSDNGRSVIGGP